MRADVPYAFATTLGVGVGDSSRASAADGAGHGEGKQWHLLILVVEVHTNEEERDVSHRARLAEQVGTPKHRQELYERTDSKRGWQLTGCV